MRPFVLICGSRSYSDRRRIRNELLVLRDELGDFVVLQGGARGADSIAADCARALGLDVVTVPADWARYGRRAGWVRNVAMLKMNPVRVVAFWDGVSRGTLHTITAARKRAVRVDVVMAA